MEGVQLQVAHWPWYYVAVYFFLGGIAAGSYLIAAIADVFGKPDEDAPIIRTGTYVAFVLILICPILLIADLGRPERFLNMLTQFKVLSPVSLGSWGLLFFGLFVTLSTAYWLARDGLFRWGPLKFLGFLGTELQRLPHRLLARVGALFGIFVAGYTGVLLSSTTNPFWNHNQYLGFTFLVSALSAAIATIAILLAWRGHTKLVALHNFRTLWIFLLVIEAVLLYWEISAPTGGLLMSGQYQLTFVVAVGLIGILIPLLLLLVNRNSDLAGGQLAAIGGLVLIGSFFLRYSILEAGKEYIDGGLHALRLLGLL